MLSPLELATLIVLIVVLVLIFKPDIMIRFARSLGELRREMKRGEEIGDETLKLANMLGIDHGGKSKEELLREIEERLQRLVKEKQA